MSIIQRDAGKIAEQLKQDVFFNQRRREVDYAWAVYFLEAFKHQDNNEDDWHKYGYEELFEQTDGFVRREAQRWARSCRKYRIYEDEFESYFRFIVYRAAHSYDGERGSFFDYLRAAIRNSGRDLVRRAKAKKYRINHLAVSLDDEKISRKVQERHPCRSAEDEAIPRIIVEQMAADKTLTDQERELFQFLRVNPDATLQEMADAIGLRDRKQALRVKQRLAQKLSKYIEE